MPTVYKVLGQQIPVANTQTTIYQVPAGNSAVISTITICNQGSTNATYRLAIQKANAALTSNHFIAYDATVLSADTVALTFGLTLEANTVLSANILTSNCSVNVFGSEIY